MEKLFESPGIINEHLPSLYKYGKTVETIVVLGDSHEAVITFVEALKCNGKERKVLIHVSPTPEKLDFGSVIYRHHTENNLLLDLSCDLLFIDSWHVYGQMKRELAKHSPTTNKYIIMHDTEVDAEHGESIRCKMNIEEQVKTSGFPIEEITKGIWPAIDEFVKLKQWKIKEKYSHNHGLTILRKQDDIDMCDYIEKEPWCVEVNGSSYLFEKIGIPTSLERKDFTHAENCGLVLMLIPDCAKLEQCVKIMKDQGQLIIFIPPRTSISEFIKVGFRVERREKDRVIFRLKPRLPTITILYALYPNVKHVEALKYFLKYVRKTRYSLKIVVVENKGPFTVKDLLDPSIIFLQRENENEDFGAFCHAVDELKIDMKEGDYLFMLNDTVWGPFLNQEPIGSTCFYHCLIKMWQ